MGNRYGTDSVPHIIVVCVYFATIARHCDVRWCPETAKYLNRLKRVDGVYLASTDGDYRALAPYRIGD